jgi:hypothetical protein
MVYVRKLLPVGIEHLFRRVREGKVKNLVTIFAKISASIVLVALLIATLTGATAQNVVTNNDVYRATNSATWMRLSGSELTIYDTLETKGWGLGGGFFGTSAQVVAGAGANVCVFIADPGSDDIAAFNSKQYVGSYNDPTGSGAWKGLALAVHGAQLYAGYSASVNIGLWRINADCSLTLANSAANTPSYAPVDGLAVSPDGKTLVAAYGELDVDSFAISGTKLKERGPFPATGPTAGIDITSDSKFAITADYSENETQVEIFPINADGTLGASDYYLIAQGGANSNNVWLSPDETLLYISNNYSAQVTTMLFDEKAGTQNRLTFDCLTTLNSPGGNFYSSGLATAETTGTGSFLYVAEAGINGAPSAIGLLAVQKGSCPVEVVGSPFLNPAGAWPITIAAYPPRPF